MFINYKYNSYKYAVYQKSLKINCQENKMNYVCPVHIDL